MEQFEKYNAKRLNEIGLSLFIEKIFEYLGDEIKKVKNSINRYDEIQYLFAHNEGTWLGLLNNAIIRAFPQSTTLQEFGVYRSSKYFGRADFLVESKDDNGKQVYLLFEAKQYEETQKDEMLKDASDYLDSIFDQAQGYFDSEVNFYQGKTVYIIPIAFGWIRKPGCLEIAKKYFKDEKKESDVDFCKLYFEDEYGAWVYGNLRSPRIK